jgi:DNA-binding NarL/FixJ family response regulator
LPTPPAGRPDVAAVRLTPRQREVLALLTDGYTIREAAARLGIAFETVRRYRKQLGERLDAHTGVHLGALGIMWLALQERRQAG